MLEAAPERNETRTSGENPEMQDVVREIQVLFNIEIKDMRDALSQLRRDLSSEMERRENAEKSEKKALRESEEMKKVLY